MKYSANLITLIGWKPLLKGTFVMIKNLFLTLLLNLFLVSNAWAVSPAFLDLISSGSSATNYTQDANCMGAWYMNNNGGNEIDRSGEGGTLIQTSGTIPTSATVPSGYSGTSRDFELGDSEYLTHADGGSTDINGADQCISIVGWVKPEDIANGVWYSIAGKCDWDGDNLQYLLELEGTGAGTYKVRGNISSDGSTLTIVSSTTTNYAAGAWRHVAMVYNDTDIRIYIDGSLHCTPGAHTTGIANKSSAFSIGCSFWPTPIEYFDGLIDEVGVFNRELNSTEINEIYTDGLSGNKGGND